VGLGLTFFVSPSTHFTAGLYHSHSLGSGTTLLSTSSRSPSTGTPSTSLASPTLATSTPSRRSVFPLVRPRPGCEHGLLRSWREGGDRPGVDRRRQRGGSAWPGRVPPDSLLLRQSN